MTTITNPFMHFEVIKDYRQAAKVEHKLSDIILLTMCGVLSGFENGIPSSGTIARSWVW